MAGKPVGVGAPVEAGGPGVAGGDVVSDGPVVAVWHMPMASFFSPLPGTATAAVCSSSSLLVATFTQHLASHPTSGSLLTTFSSLPSPLIVTSHPG